MQKKFLPRASFLIAAMALLSVSFISMRTVRAETWAPKDPPAIYPMNAGPNAVRRNDPILDICKSDTQLDCLESVEALLDGTWVKGVPDATPLEWNGYKWTIAGLKNLNGSDYVYSNFQYSYTGNLFLKALLSSPDGRESDSNGLQRNVKFRVTVRTSWVLPSHVSGKVTEGKIVVEKLPTSGASRISMEGIPMLYLIVNNQASLADPLSKGDADVRYFDMTVSDGRFFPMKKECIEKPTPLITDNAYGHAQPTFEKGNLDLKVSAPHFRKDGVTLHRGIYEAIIPLETARCLWNKEVLPNALFNIQVLDESGVEKVATTSFVITGQEVRINAAGFTYSSPTIRVQFVTPENEVVPTPATVAEYVAPNNPVSKIPGFNIASKKKVTVQKLGKTSGLKITKSSKVSVAVQKSSSKVCRMQSGTLRTLKKGACRVTVSVRTGKVTKKKTVLVTVR